MKTVKNYNYKIDSVIRTHKNPPVRHAAQGDLFFNTYLNGGYTFLSYSIRRHLASYTGTPNRIARKNLCGR